MRDDDAQNLIQIFGGVDTLARALGITEFPQELQIEILARFSENIFKRILLRVPKEHTLRVIDVLDAHAEGGEDFRELIIILEQHVPNIDASIQEEVARALERFHLDASS